MHVKMGHDREPHRRNLGHDRYFYIFVHHEKSNL